MARTVEAAALEMEGTGVSSEATRPPTVSSAPPAARSKADAVQIWAEVTRHIDDKVLAAEVSMSRGYYSRVANGQQGDLLDLAYRLPAKHAGIRAAFFARLAEAEARDPFGVAVEELVIVALRVLRMAQTSAGRQRMAKAGLE
jgi:hypothetical protein